MGVNYKRLWKLLIDKELKKTQLKDIAGVSSSTLAKLNKNEYVSLEVLVRLCKTLECELEDIVEIVHAEDDAGDNKYFRNEH
ncbi:helix-turn-helix transcriptional regulator [Fusibacter bizertensis]|uniref:Helix-turn-helix transcriptional regulator n=1 Tax=Fusibacter bizertensis TaxID=1488331 RepID=A0ABT6NE25_9FIRM|nr:helix-turn-helix transcriptional regulator [Fusibacter bizertensis]MDH8678657.1 helix-turn-helix transcriptional regulator [Fusibacter bizertensis]